MHYGADALQTERFRIRPLGLGSPWVRSLWHQIPGDQQDRPLEHSAQPTVEERMLKTISQNIQVTPELRNAEKTTHNTIRSVFKINKQNKIPQQGYNERDKTDCDFSLHLWIQGWVWPPHQSCMWVPTTEALHREGGKYIIYINFSALDFLFFCVSEEPGPQVLRTKLKGQENK